MPDTDPPPRRPDYVYCRQCGHELVPVTPSGLAIVVGGAVISHRVTLECDVCGTKRDWVPADERTRRGTQA